MKFSNPHQYESVRKQEGLKDPRDIWDTENLGGIQELLQQLPPNVQELVFESDLSPEEERCLRTIGSFCRELSENFKEGFLLLLDEYRKERRRLLQDIVEYLLKKEFLLPYHCKQATGRKAPCRV